MIPKDPVILLSYINTQLRDHYSSFEELCAALSIEPDSTSRKLADIDYHYDKDLNQFV